ncbi:hypothetical protein EJ08DRAFT_673099 [Tothia fuscella]|uniref:Uncharacterized protein n=1 Tax=Tothia fuscella TaxID=1048955 RepID=A0A9P4TTA5_9PEZI|nr:hypothetical protein EJ08DRAFT_673099 [Tothia fuscella]
MGTVAKIVANQATTAVLNVPKQSKWKRVTDVPLTRANYLDLLNGYTPLIKEAKFLTTEKCKEYEALMSRKLTPYKHNTGPLLTKYGVAQFGYQAQAADDFSKRSDGRIQRNSYSWEISTHKQQRRTSILLMRLNTSICTLSLQVPDSMLGRESSTLSKMNGTRKYFSGIFRALNNATHVHCDYSPYDSLTEDWIINQVEAQIVFNLYLAPDKAYVVPEPGALCFFNSRNMQEVVPVEQEPMVELGLSDRLRLTLSSFMGLIPSTKTGGKPKLIFWS